MQEAPPPLPDGRPDAELDLTAALCPMTFVRTRLALDRLGPGGTLLVWLRGAEPLEQVPRSAMRLGHHVRVGEAKGDRTPVFIRRRD